MTDAAFAITAAEITVTVTGTGSTETYTGAEQTADVAYALASDSELFDETKVVFAGDATVSGTTVGSYAYGLEAGDFSYADENIEATFEVTDAAFAITPAEIAITVTGVAAAPVPYTGEEQTGAVTYSVSCQDDLYDLANVVYTGPQTVSGTDAGAYPYGLTATNFSYVDDNVAATFEVTDSVFTIEPAAITVKVTGTTSTAVYTGGEQTADVAYTLSSEDELFDESKVSYNGPETVSGTEVDAYPYGMADSDFAYADDNIAATFKVDDGFLRITPATITVNVTGTDVSAVYTGAEQTGAVAYTLASESSLYNEEKVGFTGPETVAGTDAGDYAFGLAATQFSYDDDNVAATFEVADGTFTITPAPVTVTADDATKAEGAADPEFTATVEGLLDEADAVEYSFVREEGEELGGEYAITPTGEQFQGNYEVTYVAGTLTIVPAVAKDNEDNYYATLAAAVEGAPADGTVTLLANVSEGEFSIGKNLVIDLGGFTNAMTGACTVSGATVEIVNGTIESTVTTDGAFVANDGSIVLGEGLSLSGNGRLLKATDDGTVTVDGATIVGTDERAAAVYAERGGIIEVLSGSITSVARAVAVSGTDSGFILEDGTIESTGSNPIKISAGATATVSGGTVSSASYTAFWVTGAGSYVAIDGVEISASGAASAIEVSAGASATVDGGTFSAPNDKAASVSGESSVLTVNGGTFSGRYGLCAIGDSSIEVTDGTVIGTSAALYADGGTIAVSGGWFSQKVAYEFLANAHLYPSGARADAPDAAAPYTVLERPVEMVIGNIEDFVLDSETGTASFTLVATDDTESFVGATAKAYVTEDLVEPDWQPADEAIVTVAEDGRSVRVEKLAFDLYRVLFVRIGLFE